MNWCGIIAGAGTLCFSVLAAGALFNQIQHESKKPAPHVSDAQREAALVEKLTNPSQRML